MISALRFELRKLLTVRSTYVVTVIVLLIVAIGSFYIEGFRGESSAMDEHKVTNTALASVGVVAQIGFITGMLLLAHEYRYNLITYTLTAITSRSKALLAKVLTVIAYGAGLTIAAVLLAALLVQLGAQMGGHDLPAQSINFINLLSRTIFYTVGYSLLGLLLVMFMRNIIAIVIIFILPGPIEFLLGLLLKHNSIYLPFTALQQVIASPRQLGLGFNTMSPLKAALVFSAYLIIGWALAWLTFLRRDAN